MRQSQCELLGCWTTLVAFEWVCSASASCCWLSDFAQTRLSSCFKIDGLCQHILVPRGVAVLSVTDSGVFAGYALGLPSITVSTLLRCFV